MKKFLLIGLFLFGLLLVGVSQVIAANTATFEISKNPTSPTTGNILVSNTNITSDVLMLKFNVKNTAGSRLSFDEIKVFLGGQLNVFEKLYLVSGSNGNISSIKDFYNNNNGVYTFNLSTGYIIGSGITETFSVYADINGIGMNFDSESYISANFNDINGEDINGDEVIEIGSANGATQFLKSQLEGTPTGDKTPRIMMSPGAVNQHVDSNGVWQTDPDGVSGGWSSTQYPNDYGDRPIEYCKKFYSNITSVEAYKNETISTWRSRGNLGASTGTRMSYRCVQNTTTPSITVLSPNGGEVYQVGQQIPIKWTSTNIPATATINIILNNTSSEVSKNKSQSLGSVLNTGSTVVTIPSYLLSVLGKYFKITLDYTPYFTIVADSNAVHASDDSNNTFTITTSITEDGCLNGEVYSSTTGAKCQNTYIPVISGVSGPITLNVNQTGTWKVSASSLNDGGNLSYYVDWGDVYQLYSTSASQSNVSAQQSATFTHAYTTAGTYNPKFTVTNGKGSASTSLSVKVINPNDTTLPVGCTSKVGYSPITGMRCDESTNNGCLPGYKYSSTTGQPCFFTSSETTSSSNNTESRRSINRTLRLGVKGEDVKILQSFLNIAIDGSFGPETQRKVMEWQEQNGLKVDGLFGSQSIEKAGLDD